MKFVYLLERMEFNTTTDLYVYNGCDVYTSLKKVNAGLENSLECNKAYDIEIDDDKWDNAFKMVSFTTLGWGLDDARAEMKLRFVVRKVELK